MKNKWNTNPQDKSKQSMVFYKDWADVMEGFSDEVQLELFKSIVRYAFNGEIPDMKPEAKIAFGFIKPQIDRDIEKYNAIVERNRENGRYGGRPKKPKKPSGIFGNPKNLDNDNDNDNDNERENIGEKNPLSPEIKKRVEGKTPKTLEQVFEQISEDEIWKEWICMSHPKLGTTKEAKMQKHDDFMNEFYITLKARGEDYKSPSDTKAHYNSWLTKQLD